jgi:anti-sigma factor (TIGR02949 family)
MAKNILDWLRNNLRGQSGSCEDCLKILELIVDGEATALQEKQFRDHIEACLPCYESFNLEKSIKKLLQTKLEKKPVPSDLIESIKSRINETAE